MKSQDIVILLKLVSLEDDERNITQQPARHGIVTGEDPYSVRSLEAALEISKTEVSASIKRSIASGIAIKDRKTGRPRPNRQQLHEFIVHGLKFVFPAKLGPMQRGLPTAFAAPVLRDSLHSAGSLMSVWPYALGEEMGQSVEPLFQTVPEAAVKDEHLYASLALIDAVRLGNQREANLAADLLAERLG